MLAPATNDVNRSFTDALTVGDLVIYEFDQWTNAKDAMLSPTSICWTTQDLVSEPAR